jgi:hypothetical protein
MKKLSILFLASVFALMPVFTFGVSAGDSGCGDTECVQDCQKELDRCLARCDKKKSASERRECRNECRADYNDCVDDCDDEEGEEGESCDKYKLDAEANFLFVDNQNTAVVWNKVTNVVNTGNNQANGGDGGNAGDGGSVIKSDEDNMAGNAGDAGHGGVGGEIYTGDVVIGTVIENYANKNVTEVGCCPVEDVDECDETDGECIGNTTEINLSLDYLRVRNRNLAILGNDVFNAINTGGNVADGGDGGNSGDGGDVIDSDEDNIACNGGDGGNGALGGLIRTGRSTVNTEIVNMLNENVTRIRR